ncbi:MAG: exopolysaccharide biosynthesis protein [Chlamydiota bacterium]
MEKFRTLEDEILLLQQEAEGQPISLGKILRTLSGRGRALVLILLSLPFCQPLQIPGLSIPFGLSIAFVGMRIGFGKHIWLPQKLLAKKIPPAVFHKITCKTLVLVRKIKKWVRPRLIELCRPSVMRLINGLLVCLLGLILALPLPVPFTNLTAAWAIFLISFGMLEDDGALVIAGYFMTICTFLLLAAIVVTMEKLL